MLGHQMVEQAHAPASSEEACTATRHPRSIDFSSNTGNTRSTGCA
jgi:hypothetical protein